MIQFFYTIEDADGDKSTITLDAEDVDLAGGFDAAFAIEFAWDIINPLINGRLISAGMTVLIPIADFTNAAAAAISDVQEKATFVFRSAENFIKKISLPTFIETFFTGAGAGKEVDLTQSAVTAFRDMVLGGIEDALVDATPTELTTSHGEPLTVFEAGYQDWGKNRR